MTSAPATAARPAEPGHGVGKVLLIVFGSIGALIAIALLLAGLGLVWADTTQRGDDGYFTSRAEHVSSSSYAITHEGLELSDLPDWVVERLGTVRVSATGSGGSELFVGIADERDVDRYLGGVAHDEVDRLVDDPPYSVVMKPHPGGVPSNAPTNETFWAAAASGAGTQVVTWEVREGNWSFVVMNAAGERAVAADVALAIDVDWLLELGLAFLLAAALVGFGSAAMIYFGAVGSGGGAVAPVPAAALATGAPTAETYPVALEARLDEPLSRWLWLVKWLLAIPHFVVLAFLWLAFVVLTVVAFFAILLTGRYPRQVFDFNLGVMRWTWRVTYYATSGIGTDRYPPFSLGPEPDYPATLDVGYPERLSRGLVLVKSWLLAIPQLLIVALFTGSAGWAWSGRYVEWPGLIGILTIVAGFSLLFRGRYPHDLFELVVGLSRWVWRVVAYVALMRDEYPPFRLGR